MSDNAAKARANLLAWCQDLVAWRELTDEDIALMGDTIDYLVASGITETHPRQAAGQALSVLSFGSANDQDAGRWAFLYLDVLPDRRDEKAALEKARRLLCDGRGSDAHSFLDRFLLQAEYLEIPAAGLRALTTRMEGVTDSSFAAGLILAYGEALQSTDQSEAAEVMLAQCVETPMYEAAKVRFQQALWKLRGEPLRPLPEVRLDVPIKGRPETCALDVLCARHGLQGIWADYWMWRTIPEILGPKVAERFAWLGVADPFDEASCRQQYELEAGRPLQRDFIPYVRRRSEIWLELMEFGGRVALTLIGCPDLILYDTPESERIMLVEVKRRRERISLPQRAWGNYLLDRGFDYFVARFA